jgi:hypothetical protein
MTHEDKIKIRDTPRCLHCGILQSQIDYKLNCVHRWITWQELVSTNRDLFIKLMKAEDALYEKTLTRDRAEVVLNKIRKYKQPALFEC